MWGTLLRVVGAGLLLGSLFTPGFWLSLGGALASLLLLGASRVLPARHFSLVSHSLLAAQAHLLGQLLLVRLFLIPYDNILLLFPPLALAALLSGIANGLIASHLVQAHDKD
ncbi:Heptaprenyl diphosphate synthase component I [compost metagenome]